MDGHAVLKIDNMGRIDGLPEEARLEMEMRTGRTACVSAQTDGVARTDDVVHFHQLFGKMAVDGFQSVRMADNEVIAVAAAFVIADAHFPVEGGADGIALIDYEVDAHVHPAAARAIFRGYPNHRINREDEGGAIYQAGVWEFHFFFASEGVDPAGVPIRAVEFVGGEHEVFAGYFFGEFGFGELLKGDVLFESDAFSHQFRYLAFHYVVCFLYRDGRRFPFFRFCGLHPWEHQ